MQLDRTAITITQRSAFELIDMSLIVVRRYWQSLIIHGVIGILPFALINAVLLWPTTKYEALVMASRDYATVDGYHFRYLCLLAGMVFLQAPLALSGVTYYIGRAVFIEEPSVRQVLHSVWQRWFALIYIIGFWRLSFAPMILGVFLWTNSVFEPVVEVMIFGIFVVGGVYFIRGFRPFATEILLLERCPLRTKKNDKTKLSYQQRSTWLHANLSGELFGVHVGVTLVAMMTTLAVTMGFVFCVGVLVGNWRWGIWLDLFFFPAALWGVAVWCTVIRFLVYMNSRIRLEGWEVELKLKAEAERLREAV